MYSSGRDAQVFWQDLRRDENRALVFRESAPVLKMILTPDQGGLWVSTSDSNVKYWDVGRADLSASARGPASRGASAVSSATGPAAATSLPGTQFNRRYFTMSLVILWLEYGLWYHLNRLHSFFLDPI